MSTSKEESRGGDETDQLLRHRSSSHSHPHHPRHHVISSHHRLRTNPDGSSRHGYPPRTPKSRRKVKTLHPRRQDRSGTHISEGRSRGRHKTGGSTPGRYTPNPSHSKGGRRRRGRHHHHHRKRRRPIEYISPWIKCLLFSFNFFFWVNIQVKAHFI